MLNVLIAYIVAQLGLQMWKVTPQNEDLPGNKGKMRQEQRKMDLQCLELKSLNRHQQDGFARLARCGQ